MQGRFNAPAAGYGCRDQDLRCTSNLRIAASHSLLASSSLGLSFNDFTSELLGKLISQAGFALIGMAGMTIGRQELSDVLIPGTLTDCLNAGKAMRQAKEESGDTVAKIVSATGSFGICRGVITSIDASDGRCASSQGYLSEDV